MSILLSAQSLSKSFSAKLLFDNLNFGIHRGDKISLVGANGAGKTTLMKILAGLESADKGRVTLAASCRVAYLAQDPQFKKGSTVLDCAMEGAEASGLLHMKDEWELTSKAFEWISRFDFAREGISESTLVEELSGGWKKRVGLLRELMKEADLLLLDEPTNHLDLESILWLEELLLSANFAYLVVTHDRKFMQRVSEKVFDLDRRYPDGILQIEGTYSDYLYSREQVLAAQNRLEDRMRNNLRREFAWMIKEPKARTTKSKSRVDRTLDLQNELGDLENKNLSRTTQLSFVATQGGTQKLVELKNSSKFFGDRCIFKDVDFMVTLKSRMGLLGANGAGKSTLIKILLGKEALTSGTRYAAETLSPIYFSQEKLPLDPKATPVTTLCPQNGEYVEFGGRFVHINGYLEKFLLGGDKARTAVSKLSGGEQSRLRLAQLMLSPGNLLVLDEPTNDLDLETLRVLEDALKDFPGALLLVSHDRAFIDQVCQEIIVVEKGKLERFADVLQWEEKYWERKSSEKLNGEVSAANANGPTEKTKKKKLSYKLQLELDSMESEIHKAEDLLRVSSEKLENPDEGQNLAKNAEALANAQKKVEALYSRWEELLKLQS